MTSLYALHLKNSPLQSTKGCFVTCLAQGAQVVAAVEPGGAVAHSLCLLWQTLLSTIPL